MRSLYDIIYYIDKCLKENEKKCELILRIIESYASKVNFPEFEIILLDFI